MEEVCIRKLKGCDRYAKKVCQNLEDERCKGVIKERYRELVDKKIDAKEKVRKEDPVNDKLKEFLGGGKEEKAEDLIYQFITKKRDNIIVKSSLEVKARP
jgi:hypothetical protein